MSGSKAKRILSGLLLVPVMGWAQRPVVDYREASQVPNEKKLEQATSAVGQIRDVLKFALERQKKAEEGRDLIQLNCVNEVLGSLRGQLHIANQGIKALEGALTANDQDQVDHEFTKISVAEMTAGTFRVEVEGCVGEASSYTGRTVVDLQVDDDIRQDDAAAEADEASTFPTVDVDRPEALTGSE